MAPSRLRGTLRHWHLSRMTERPSPLSCQGNHPPLPSLPAWLNLIWNFGLTDSWDIIFALICIADKALAKHRQHGLVADYKKPVADVPTAAGRSDLVGESYVRGVVYGQAGDGKGATSR